MRRIAQETLGATGRAGVVAAALLFAAAAQAAEVCPDIGFVPDTTRLTQFRPGQGRTLDDVRYDLVVQQVADVICREKDRRVRVSMKLDFQAQRGRADPGGRVEFSYFVAIVHRVTKQVIAKEIFPVAVDFPQNRAVVTIEEELEQTIPYKKGEEPVFYAILIGLQVNEEQLAYNRVRRGESPEERAARAPGAALPTLPGLPAPSGAPASQQSAPQQSAPQRPAQAQPLPGLPTLPKPN